MGGATRWIESRTRTQQSAGLFSKRYRGLRASVRTDEGAETIWFDYPRTYESPATFNSIKLEIGPLAAWSPSEETTIVPYAASVMPDVSGTLSTKVRTVSPQRTFWEKATIVHQEAMRPEEKRMPRRYSRHYYDLYRLGNSPSLNRHSTTSHFSPAWWSSRRSSTVHPGHD